MDAIASGLLLLSFALTSTAQFTTKPPKNKPKKPKMAIKLSAGILAAIVAAVVVLIIVAVIVLILFRRRQKKRGQQLFDQKPEEQPSALPSTPYGATATTYPPPVHDQAYHPPAQQTYAAPNTACPLPGLAPQQNGWAGQNPAY